MSNEKRIVLRTNNNLSFTGESKGNISLDGKEYIWVITCQESGFGVLCPVDFVENIIKIDLE